MLIQDMDQAVSRDKCNHQQITFSFSQTDGYTYFDTKTHIYIYIYIEEKTNTDRQTETPIFKQKIYTDRH